jgi:hypothetical protein
MELLHRIGSLNKVYGCTWTLHLVLSRSVWFAWNKLHVFSPMYAWDVHARRIIFKKGTFWFSCLKLRMWWPRWFKIIIAHPKSHYRDHACMQRNKSNVLLKMHGWANVCSRNLSHLMDILLFVICDFILATEASWNYVAQKWVSRDLHVSRVLPNYRHWGPHMPSPVSAGASSHQFCGAQTSSKWMNFPHTQ